MWWLRVGLVKMVMFYISSRVLEGRDFMGDWLCWCSVMLGGLF